MLIALEFGPINGGGCCLPTCSIPVWRLYLLANQEDPMDLPNFMRHVARHYLRIQEGDAQRAATSAAVPHSSRGEP